MCISLCTTAKTMSKSFESPFLRRKASFSVVQRPKKWKERKKTAKRLKFWQRLKDLAITFLLSFTCQLFTKPIPNRRRITR